MRIHACATLVSVFLAAGAGLGASPAWALSPGHAASTPIQYRQYPDQGPGGYYPDGRYDPRDDPRARRDGADRYPGDAYGGGFRKWRPGEVVPGEFLGSVVDDWEERGLSRPPGGHLWVRVGLQFILVRERDQRIARTVNFD